MGMYYRTAINGYVIQPSENTHITALRLLERGKMFVFSQEQLRRLLSSSSHLTAATHPLGILDIGSGDGHVTDRIKEVFQAQTVHVTETSQVMQRLLKRRNYKYVYL